MLGLVCALLESQNFQCRANEQKRKTNMENEEKCSGFSNYKFRRAYIPEWVRRYFIGSRNAVSIDPTRLVWVWAMVGFSFVY